MANWSSIKHCRRSEESVTDPVPEISIVVRLALAGLAIMITPRSGMALSVDSALSHGRTAGKGP